MGQSESPTQKPDPNFPMHKYLNQGLTSNQVLMIRAVFNSYQPQDDLIESSKYKESLMQSELKDLAIAKLERKSTLNFD